MVQGLQALLGSGVTSGSSDAQLLDRFIRHQGLPEAGAAFEAIVARHGPLVLGVCRRSLREPEDIADAFQATFLVLVRKAYSLRVRDSLAPWLYGVSRRIAAKTRVSRARRDRSERREQNGEISEAPVSFEAERRELIAAVDKAIERLPAPFRSALVLCDIEGLTHEAAAEQLGCPVGTIESRLSRGRARLRRDLERRGYGLSFMGPVSWFKPPVPESLAAGTVKFALLEAEWPISLSRLVSATLKELMMRRVLFVLGTVGGIALMGCLGLLLLGPRLGAQQVPGQADVPLKTSKEGEQTLLPPVRFKPGDVVTIFALEALPGRPLEGKRLVRSDGTISLGYYGDLSIAGLNRHETKIKLINHLRNYLSDDYLGLSTRIEEDGSKRPDEDKLVPIAPEDSDRVFVDDSLVDHTSTIKPGPTLPPARKLKPGDQVLIEVLEALPGRPLAGVKKVRPDGTISLEVYGDLKVAGLDRRQVKIALIEHLRIFLSDDSLGLTEFDPKSNKERPVKPVDSDRVYVDDSVAEESLFPEGTSLSKARLDAEHRHADPKPNSAEVTEQLTANAIRRQLQAQSERLSTLDSKLNLIMEKMKNK